MPEFVEKYINPFTDYGFKRLFGEEPNKELLLDFLNELLKNEQGKITSLTYLKSDRLGNSEDDRKAVFDLYCENKDGEKFIVELQKTKQKFFKDKPVGSLESRFDKWMYVIRNLNKLDRVPDELRESIFERLFEVAEIAKFSKEEAEAYEESLKSYRDLKNSLDTAREEAIDKRNVEIVQNSLKTGLTIEMIASITGLSSEKIERIKNEG